MGRKGGGLKVDTAVQGLLDYEYELSQKKLLIN